MATTPDEAGEAGRRVLSLLLAEGGQDHRPAGIGRAQPAERTEDHVLAPHAPADCVPACGRAARLYVGNPGLRLAQQLKKLFP